MWIKLKTLMAGPEGVYQAGAIIDHPDGQLLVDTGQAEPSKPPKRAETETAALPPAENGMKPRAKPRKKITPVGAQTTAATGQIADSPENQADTGGAAGGE